MLSLSMIVVMPQLNSLFFGGGGGGGGGGNTILEGTLPPLVYGPESLIASFYSLRSTLRTKSALFPSHTSLSWWLNAGHMDTGV